jgi:hypothetical protein
MAPLAVDPPALYGAGAAMTSTGEGLGSVVSTLTTALAGCNGMAGDDPAGAAFGQSYNRSASKLLEAMATTRNGLCGLGYGVRISAHNYSVAEASSNISGRGEPLPTPRPTAPVSAGSAPSAVGSDMGAPAGWGWVAPFIGMIWPSGDSAKLRAAAAAWISAGTNFEVSEITGAAGPMGTVGAQQIPEGPAMAAAFAEANRSAAGILQQSVSIAAQLNAYAAKIDNVHAAILDLLSRICDPMTGFKEVWDILTDQDEDEIKKIANDIRTVVNNFTAEVDALRQQIAATLTEATTILTTMGRYAEREWDQFLHHTDVGRAVNQVAQFDKGLAEEAGGLIEDGWTYGAIRPFVDPKGSYDSWRQLVHGMAPLVGLGDDHAPGVAQAWKDLGKNAVHWDEWKTNPAEAAGKSTFDIATLFVPGGGEAAAGAKGARAAADAAEAAAKTAPREAAIPRALEDVPKPAAPAPAPHPEPPHPAAPHEEPATPHGPVGGRPEPPPPPNDASVPHDPTPHSPVESKAPSTEGPSPGEGTTPPAEPADPGHGPPPPPGGGPPPPPGQGPGPPPPPPMPPHPPGDGIPSATPPTEPPPPPITPSGDGPPPAAAPHPPSPASPAGEGHPPAVEPPQPAATTPSGEGHPPAAEESLPAASVPTGHGNTPAADVPQLVPAGAGSSQLPLAGEPLPSSALSAQAAASAGAHSAELAPKAADAAQHRAAVPAGRPSNLPDAGQPHERPLTQHTPQPHTELPAEQPPVPQRAHGDGSGTGHGGNGHGGHGDGDTPGKGREDPVHSHQQSGDGWERLSDEPRHPHYGEPLDHHWQYPHDPTDPSRIHPDVAKLIKDPEAPFGRDPQGHAYTQHEYEERFNKEGPDGQHWYNYASADGAVAGTKVAFTDLEQFKKFYGDQFDRVGNEDGRYLAVMENGKPAAWERRSLHVDSVDKPLHGYVIDHLPEGWKIEVSEIEPAVGQPGGALQVLIFDDTNEALTTRELTRDSIGVLRELR